MTVNEELRRRLSRHSSEDLLALVRRRDTDQWRPEVFSVAADILRSRGVPLPEAPSSRPPERPEPEVELVPIAKFTTVVESDACRSALEAAGFDVVALDEFVLRLDQSLGPGLGGVRLAVPRDQAEEARAFLAAAERGDFAEASLECPTCGSSAVRSERRVSRGATVVNYLLGVPTTDTTVEFSCQGCGKSWE